jgi:hypothetical protein
MTTGAARDTLRQPFAGDRPGVTFYSAQPRGAWQGGTFPAGHFPGLVKDGVFTMHGDTWEITLWDLTFDEFPSGDAWRAAVDRTFDWIFASGGVVAWIGDGVGYAAPPKLFDGEQMANSVFEGRGRNGVRVGELDLDAPARYLDATQMAALREASCGLATSA